MSLLRIPWDAIGATIDIYDGASTRLRLPAGLSSLIRWRRGTLQGDTLSPLLFLLYLEPLLQWLQVGDAGYLPGCSSHPCNRDLPTKPGRAASCHYADDGCIISGSAPDHAILLRKVELSL